MLRGILRVYDKFRPGLLDRPRELALLDAQVARIETERLAAEVREAMDNGDLRMATEYLNRLYARQGGARLAMMRIMARWTPRLLMQAHKRRRERQAAQRRMVRTHRVAA